MAPEAFSCNYLKAAATSSAPPSSCPSSVTFRPCDAATSLITALPGVIPVHPVLSPVPVSQPRSSAGPVSYFCVWCICFRGLLNGKCEREWDSFLFFQSRSLCPARLQGNSRQSGRFHK